LAKQTTSVNFAVALCAPK